jgi:hypothetical protein
VEERGVSAATARAAGAGDTGFVWILKEESEMVFVNEYVSDEDIKKYKLNEIWLKYHPEHKSVPDHYRHEWTVDRERDIYLKWVSVGREEHSNRLTFVLYWKGEFITVELDLVGIGRTQKLTERPYRKVWELVGIWPSQPKTAKREEVLAALKEALTVRGYDGARRQIPDTIVEFKNC